MEKTFIKTLIDECKCVVSREIDPRPARVVEGETKYYLLHFEHIPCPGISDTDKLQNQALHVAQRLKNFVLKHSDYEEITIMYSCDTGEHQMKVESFTYKTKQLNRRSY